MEHEHPRSFSAAATADVPAVLLLHGWQNHRPSGHWQYWLAERLAERGHQVAYPQLPDPDTPVLDEWVAAAAEAFQSLRGPRRLVICHSLGCLAWLHLVARGRAGRPADRLALVAPPSPRVLRGIPEIAAFVFEHLEDAQLGAREARLVHSSNDPFCPEGAGEVYGRPLRLDSDLLFGQGHFDIAAGYGSWPGLLDWATDGRLPITGRSELETSRIGA